MTKIEWVKNADGDRGETWNPVVGCSLVSPGCTNCYAMRQAHRNALMGTAHYLGLTKTVNRKPVWTGVIAEAPWHIFDAPRSRRKPTTYFVNSMGDLYHEDIPDSLIDRVHNTMLGAKQHTYQVLTKRSKRMREYWSRFKPDGQGWITRDGKDAMNNCRGEVVFADANFPPKGWWLGVSAERQQEWDERVENLGATPAYIRFVSVEPLLSEIDCGNAFDPPPDGSPYRPVDWVIIGGESGPGARSFPVEAARAIVAQCRAAGVKVFVKQMGAKPMMRRAAVLGDFNLHQPEFERLPLRDRKGGDMSEWPPDLRIRQFPQEAHP